MGWRTLIALAAPLMALLPLPAFAQGFTVPAAPPPDGAALFRNQCGTCHTLSAKEPLRQGPPLGGVIGRRAGSVPGFAYSPGFAKADFTWDAAHLDRWLTKPQDVIPGAVMAYRQADPATRARIIDWLKEQR